MPKTTKKGTKKEMPMTGRCRKCGAPMKRVPGGKQCTKCGYMEKK